MVKFLNIKNIQKFEYNCGSGHLPDVPTKLPPKHQINILCPLYHPAAPTLLFHSNFNSRLSKYVR